MITDEYKVWRCQQVGKSGYYSVSKCGCSPIFVDGAYYWTLEEAKIIADNLNKNIKEKE